ncbi:hypothetical protein ACGGKE_03750 [Sphingobium naphthae]
MIDALREVSDEAGEAGHDGWHSDPLHSETVAKVRALLSKLEAPHG